jgi:hypothetical protein
MLETALAERGFVFVTAADMRAAIEAAGSLPDWDRFAASWNDLETDTYLAEGKRSRTRRFGVYQVDCRGTIARQPHQPHYQYPEYNRLFGGIERWFAPIAPDVGGGATMLSIIGFCARVFGKLAEVPRWHVEAHQFRVAARADLPGQPTPEGVHRDGVDYVLVLLVNRDNIVSGVTTVYDLAGVALGTFTLTEPFDAVFVDDNRLAHGVTAVEPLDRARPGCRDVLVVTFRRNSALL